jgi:MFS family permease
MKVARLGPRMLAHAFRSLRSRNYRLFWFGQLISLTGTWMQDVALGWLILTLTDSPMALGTMTAIRFLPIMLLALHGGVFADRLPKRRVLIASQSTQFAVALTLAVLTSGGHITVAIIYVLAGVRGLVDALDGPTRQSFVPEMVGMEDLSNAIALNSTLFNGARIFGPAVAAAVISTLGMAACFFFNAGSFLAVIVALLAMRRSELHLVPRMDKGKIWLQLREGLRYARHTPEVLVIILVMSLMGPFGYNFNTTLPLVAKYILSSGASTLALLFSAIGAGSVVAGLVAASLKGLSQRILLTASGMFVFLLAGVGLSVWPPLTVALLFLLGFTAVIWATTANTRIQLSVPGHLRGRVMGIYMLLFAGTTPIGGFVAGLLAEHTFGGKRAGSQAMMIITAGLCAVSVVAGVLYAWRSRGEAQGGVSPT